MVDEFKTIKETKEMELVQFDEECYTLYLHCRGVNVVLDDKELAELRELLK